MTSWLVVPCPGSRADELARCLGSLAHPPEQTVVVTTAQHDPFTDWDRLPAGLHISIEHGDDFTIARLWNLGLDVATRCGATEVAVFASDVVGHPGSIPTLAAAMRTAGAVMAGPALDDRTRILDGARTCADRVPGACFMLAAEAGLRCDEDYRWWYSDDDLEMAARAVGPVAVFAGTGLTITGPDTELTPEKQQWADEDRARFVAKWGSEPW